jgi:hypothetical protein
MVEVGSTKDRGATRGKAIRLLAVVLLNSCATTSLSTVGVCPEAAQPPTPVPAPAPAWQRSGRSSLDLSLSYPFTQAIIKQRVAAIFPANGSYGPDIQSVALEQPLRNGAPVNQIAVRFGLFFRKTDGTTSAVPSRTYTLRVEIYPQLITAATIPDSSLRRSLLHCSSQANCGDNGVVLNFYFSELDGGPNFPDKAVDCRGAGFDAIDQFVLSTAYNLSTTWPPLPVPLDGILQFVKDMTKVSAVIAAVDLGTEQTLKLAAQLDQGGAGAFDPAAVQFSQFPDVDWLLSIDTGLISSSIVSNVVSAVSQLDSAAHLSAPTVAFTASGITIAGSGTKSFGLCGDVPYGFLYTATPNVCRRNQDSVVEICVDPTQPPGPRYTSAGQQACVGTGAFFSGLFGQGIATAIITTPCQQEAYLNVPLVDDLLYATGANVDGQFLVLGRSRNMDASQPTRQSLPPQCQ